MFYNSVRMPAKEDPLRYCTESFQGPKSNRQDSQEEEEDDDDNFFDGVFNLLSSEHKQLTGAISTNAPAKLSLNNLRKAGARGCGFNNLPSIAECTPSLSDSAEEQERTNLYRRRSEIPTQFISAGASPQGNSTTTAAAGSNDMTVRDKPTPFQLMELTYRNTRRRLQLAEQTAEEARSLESYVEADGTCLSIIEWSHRPDLNLDKEQQLAFQIVTAAFMLTYYQDAESLDPSVYRTCSDNPSQIRRDFRNEKGKLQRMSRLRHNQLIMYLDGAGGAGKSRVVQELLKYAQEFTARLGLQFDMRTIVVSAMSGVAAVSIGGETTHSVAAFFRNIDEKDTTWANARLLIIDEVSFMSTAEVDLLDEKLRCLMRKYNALFGEIHILFCGDFRFREDPEWGCILSRLRNDTYTQHDIDAVNQCCIKVKPRAIPGNASYCVYGNADRTAINDAGVFSNVLKAHWQTCQSLPNHIVAITAGNMVRVNKAKKKIPMEETDKHYIFEHCGDHRIRAKIRGRRGGHFIDPMLKLYYHIPLMLVSNDDVPNGHANGTRVLLEAVVTKPNVTASTIIIDGYECPALDASNVDYLVCSSEEDPQKIFKIHPKTLQCSIQAPIPKAIAGHVQATINLTASLLQFPIITNRATTGHKLQGQNKHNLVVAVWSKRKNWNYVALSRVRTRQGLYLLQKLQHDADFSMSHDLREMRRRLSRLTPAVLEWDLEEERRMRDIRRRHASNRAAAT
ncbi:DNA helicase [Seminavis robusta]|uniref:ATP-dependent DNA helicase n=1 Tax=Seminavis robusta TaxID=568900 RepID=A0A9N8EW93_9STRA|nr:DNA helicase [Seminavis robusta]|eukprot:Sro2191_g318350.1 DNA helicase (736) ;mRNA; f:7407-9797